MANEELKEGLKKALTEAFDKKLAGEKLDKSLDEQLAADSLSDFKENFNDLIKYNRKELEKLTSESKFCETVIAGEDEFLRSNSDVKQLIKKWQLRIDENKAESQKLATNQDASNEQELSETENKAKFLKNINSNRQEVEVFINDMIVQNNPIKDIQEILVFVIKEKLLPAQTIKKLSNQFLAVKNSAQNQDQKIDDLGIYSEGEIKEIIQRLGQNHSGEKLNLALLGKHIDFERANKTFSYHFEQINSLVLQISSSEQLTPKVIEKALSYIEGDKRETENKKALISALETRALLEPEAFLCLDGKNELIDKLEKHVDVVSIAANQGKNKGAARQLFNIGFRAGQEIFDEPSTQVARRNVVMPAKPLRNRNNKVQPRTI